MSGNSLATTITENPCGMQINSKFLAWKTEVLDGKSELVPYDEEVAVTLYKIKSKNKLTSLNKIQRQNKELFPCGIKGLINAMKCLINKYNAN